MTLRFAGSKLFAATLVASVSQPFASAQADPIIDWNIVALDATAVPPNAILQSRVLAIVHAAAYNAVCAVQEGCTPYAVSIKAPPGTSVDAAVAAAAHDVLVKLAPAQETMLDLALTKSLAKIQDGSGKGAGLAVGSQVAERLLALRSKDQADAKAIFTSKAGAGLYQPTPPSSLSPILPHWGSVMPFILRDEHRLAFKGAPPLSSAAFVRDYNEVKNIGHRNSTTRTADQTAAAIFWTVQTAVPWHAAARAKASARSLSVSENARLFALLSLSTADSQIIAFKEKYARPHWRPITAIRAAGDLRNNELEPDPSWEPLLGTPAHPEYPSAHAVFSGTAEAVLRSFFDSDDVDVSVTFPAIVGVTRTYKSFSAMTAEVGNARVWGGIHFRSAVDDAIETGREIGKIAVREFPGARRQRRPGSRRAIMFDLDQFIADCLAAQASDRPIRQVREVVARAVCNPAAVLRCIGEPRQAAMQKLYHGQGLTILNVVFAPGMTIPPHDHRMLAVIGIYTGREENVFWRRKPGGRGGQLEPVSAKLLGERETAPLGPDIIHSVTNSLSRLTGAIHVYGGDFFGAERSEWDSETLQERRFDVEAALRRFDAAENYVQS